MPGSDKIKRCLKEGEHGERHKGLRKVSSNEEKVNEHVAKAIHNLKAMAVFKEQGFSDWSASAGFYSLYHLLLAILSKKGYESRNQSCTFALIEEMIGKGELAITQEDLKEIFDKEVTIDIEHSSKILDLREKYQYSTKTRLEKEEFDDLRGKVKELFDLLRNQLENI